MGNHHHPIVTTNREAQQYFDQGFNFVFGFNHEEAVRSFRRAAELDPKAPMPHWGIAWALGPNYNLDVDDARANQANVAMAQALELAKSAAEYREVGQGDAFRHRARFFPGDALKLRDLFEIVDAYEGTEVLFDDRPIPYARQLWLPLVWFLILR